MAWPPNWETAGLQYLARDGHILVRDADISRVQEVLGGRPVGDRPSNINGLTLFAYAEDRDLTVESACDLLDRELGRGVATPDHVFYVVPASGTCPATEPEPVHSPCRPYPEPGADPCAGEGVLVKILDSGLFEGAAQDYDWLSGVTGDTEDTYFPAPPDRSIRHYAGHGTFSAGVVRTMAPGAEVTVLHTFTPVHAGSTYESELASDIVQALSDGPDIISLSFGTYTRSDIPPLGIDVLEPLLRGSSEVVLVAAAGNDSTRDRFWPAAYPWVTSVGALDRSWTRRAWFSNHGCWVSIYAPGEDLVNAFPKGVFTCNEPPNKGQGRVFTGMGRWSGTSFATPMVAGMIAARMTVTGESAPEAVAALRAEAVAKRIPGVGPVLVPGS
ncbi:MAG: S8/S53 family peptidase [Kineosporiaceae bacterium]